MSEIAECKPTHIFKGGTEVTIRAIRPGDEDAIRKAFSGLKPETIRLRFFHLKRALTQDDLRWVDEADCTRHPGLVATISDADGGRIVAEADYVVRGQAAEIAFAVAEDWRGRGLASRMLQDLARLARAQGLTRFEAEVLRENAPMLAVFRRSGFPMTTRFADGVAQVALRLDSCEATPAKAN
jgi:RimJ/RimL family protein N-acetyltransferase